MTDFEEYKKQGDPRTFNLPEIPGSLKRGYPENYPKNFRSFKERSAGDAQRIGGIGRHNGGRDQVEHRKAEKSGQTAPHRWI